MAPETAYCSNLLSLRTSRANLAWQWIRAGQCLRDLNVSEVDCGERRTNMER